MTVRHAGQMMLHLRNQRRRPSAIVSEICNSIHIRAVLEIACIGEEQNPNRVTGVDFGGLAARGLR